jgi:hypothetical protein
LSKTARRAGSVARGAGLWKADAASGGARRRWGQQPVASLDHKIELALNEARILVLVTQVLIGFQYRAIFEPVFEQLPPTARYLLLGSLALQLVALAILELCATYHLVVAHGQNSPDIQRFASRAIEVALFPFAVALGLSVYVVVAKVTESPLAAVASAALALTLFYGLWFGFTLYRRHQRAAMPARHSFVAPSGLQPPSPHTPAA